MKYIKDIPATILGVFIYWLAFAQNYTFFVWTSWAVIGLAIIGLFTEDFKQKCLNYDIINFLISIPFSVVVYWILWKFDEDKVFMITSIILSLIIYSAVFHHKYNKHES